MSETETSSVNKNGGQGASGGPPIVFFVERSFFGDRKTQRSEWITHEELYESIGKVINPGSITGLQRVRGLWRIYVGTLTDKVALLTQGVSLRGTPIELLNTNPRRLDGEGTTRVRIKNIPLSVDDTVVTHPLILRGLDVITVTREKLRIKGKLTNCQTGDRLVVVNTLSLKEPLPTFMSFGIYTGRVIHTGQLAKNSKEEKCTRCLKTGHKKAECSNDWMCLSCHASGHKKGNCPLNEGEKTSISDDDASPADDSLLSGTERNAPSREKAGLMINMPKKDSQSATHTGKDKTAGNRQVRIQQSAGTTPWRISVTSSDTEESLPTPAEVMNELFKKSRQTSEVPTGYQDHDEHSFV